MELQRPVAPEAAREALRHTLMPLAHHNPTAEVADLYLQIDPEDRIELPVYLFRNIDPLRVLSPPRPDPTGWAFIVRTQVTDSFHSEFSLAFLAARPPTYKFTHMVHGWLPKLVVEGAKHSATINDSLDGTFVPTLFSVFGARSTCLWLQSVDLPTSERDCIIRLHARQLAQLSQPEVTFRAEPLARFLERVAAARSATRTDNAPRSPHPSSELFKDAPLPRRRTPMQ